MPPPVRALSREQRELLLAFNNLSSVPHWLSDALCRLATDGSFAVRQLYTDDEEVLFEATRPITGSASDLLRLCAEGAREDAFAPDRPSRCPALEEKSAPGVVVPRGHAGSAPWRTSSIRLSALGQSHSSAVGLDRNDGQNWGRMAYRHDRPHRTALIQHRHHRSYWGRTQFEFQRGSPRAILTVLTQEVALPGNNSGGKTFRYSSAPR